MKLEVKHLAPYLPYNLKMMIEGEVREMTEINTITEYKVWYTAEWDSKKLKFFPEDNIHHSHSGQGSNTKDVSPILRPLSDLNKTILVNGSEITPLKEIAYIEENCIEITHFKGDIFHKCVTKGDDSWVFSQFSNYPEITRKLFEWHFDVFGLIEKGLAIDINTL